MGRQLAGCVGQAVRGQGAGRGQGKAGQAEQHHGVAWVVPGGRQMGWQHSYRQPAGRPIVRWVLAWVCACVARSGPRAMRMNHIPAARVYYDVLVVVWQ